MKRSSTDEARDDGVVAEDDPTLVGGKKSRRGEQGRTNVPAASAPVQEPSHVQLPVLLQPLDIPTDDFARRSMIEREMAVIRQEINYANTCLQQVLRQDRDLLRRTFGQIVNSASTLMSVFSPEEDFTTIDEKLTQFLQDHWTRYNFKEQRLLEIQTSLNASTSLALNTLNQQGFCTDEAKESDPKSGLFYIRDSHWIAFGGDSTSTIGILECFLADGKQSFRQRMDLAELPPCNTLEEAWSFIKDEKLSKSQFISKLVKLLPSLDPKILRNAWHSFQTQFPSEDIDQMGEMALQQFVYPPFAHLFKAAIGFKQEACYRANQDVCSSLSIQYKVNEGDEVFLPRRIIIQPDGAATMDDEGWDVLGMMELMYGKPSFKRVTLIEYDRCVLVTAIAALAMKRCIDTKDYDRIAIPFLIATGGTCSLFAATLDKNGIPRIKKVGYPGGRRALNQRFTTSKCQARTEIFTALAVLLHQFKSFFNDYDATYKEKIRSRTSALTRIDRLSLITNSNAQSAIEAADCGGQFVLLEYPIIRNLDLLDTGTSNDERLNSPFFFIALPSPSSTKVLTKNKVFLRMWNTGEVNIRSVESEWMHYKQVWEAGVPVAPPALPEVGRSTSSDGTNYLIIAVEYIQQDQIGNWETFVQFCHSLVDTVERLHNQAKLLHCDLKPDNVLWRDGVVHLIDFDHAQPISSAKPRRGTKGFEAPEILNGRPCSTKTDAFAVGKTILAMLRAFDEAAWQKSNEFRILQDVAVKLSHSDPQSRWCLQQALDKLQNIMLPGNDSFRLMKADARAAANPAAASP